MAAPMKFCRTLLHYRSSLWRTCFSRAVGHHSKHLKILTSVFRKETAFGAKCLLAFPAVFSTKVFAASPLPAQETAGDSSTTFEPNDSRLRSSECLKNAAGLAVDSSSAVLSQTVYTIINIERQYVELLDVLVQLLDYQTQVLGHPNEFQRIEDIVLETRHEIGKVIKRKEDLTLLFSSVEKLADATAEVAFASGADYASTSAGERLHSAQLEVQRVQRLSEEAKKRLSEVEARVIDRVTKHDEKLKKLQEKSPSNTNENNNVELDLDLLSAMDINVESNLSDENDVDNADVNESDTDSKENENKK